VELSTSFLIPSLRHDLGREYMFLFYFIRIKKYCIEKRLLDEVDMDIIINDSSIRNVKKKILKLLYGLF
jgi:hypothetical protein